MWEAESRQWVAGEITAGVNPTKSHSANGQSKKAVGEERNTEVARRTNCVPHAGLKAALDMNEKR